MRIGRLGKFSCAKDAPGTARNASNTPIRHKRMVRPCPGFSRGFEGARVFGQDADNLRSGQAPRHQAVHQAVLGAATLRGGIVIAATPATTQASPTQAVDASCSPRNVTPMATPIGTRK